MAELMSGGLDWIWYVPADQAEAAAATIDRDQRLANYDRATRRMNEQVMWHPLWTNPVTYAHAEKLDFNSFPDENPRFYLMKWKD